MTIETQHDYIDCIYSAAAIHLWREVIAESLCAITEALQIFPELKTFTVLENREAESSTTNNGRRIGGHVR